MYVPYFQIFRRLMKGKIDAYVLWPLAKKFQNWIVDRSTARDFTVYLVKNQFRLDVPCLDALWKFQSSCCMFEYFCFIFKLFLLTPQLQEYYGCQKIGSLTTEHKAFYRLVFSKHCGNHWNGNGILLPKLFWPTVRKNCSSDQEKLCKFWDH